MKTIATLLTALFLGLFSAGANASPGAVEFVRGVFVDLSSRPSSAVLTKKTVISKVSHYYDFGALFERASQDFRAALTAEQVERLKAIFADVVAKKIAQKVDRLIGKDLKNPKYSLKAGQDKESVVSVHGTVNQRPVKLEFSVVPNGGGYKIVDLSVEGALLSRNYRGQFNRIFRIEGAPGLEKRMQAQLVSL